MEMTDILLNAAGHLYWKDKQGRYLGCNHAFAELLGLTSTKAIFRRTDFDFLPQEDAEKIYQIDQQILQEGKIVTLEEVGKDKQGRPANYLTNKRPLFENGVIIGLMGTSINITAQKQAEAVKEEFLNNMRHDLRTPFCGIIGVVELLQESETDAHKQELLGYVSESSTQLLQIINDVFSLLARTDNLPPQSSFFKIREVVKRVVAPFKPSIALKNLALKFECPNQLIRMDRIKLEKILAHLVSNSVKFTDKGEIKVTTLLKKKDSILHLAVSDTGIGMPAEKAQIIFEPFTKLKPSYQSGRYIGVGNGLALTKQLVDDLNGDIQLNSVLGKGSTFTISLPLTGIK